MYSKEQTLMASFGLLSLVCYLLAYGVYRRNRRRIYALTNQRVLFIYPGTIFKPAESCVAHMPECIPSSKEG